MGPREGFQTIPRVVPTSEKLELIDALSETGVREMEIASFVRADRLPQMADAEDIVSQYARKTSVQYLGLYLNQKGFERAEQTKRLDNRGWIYSAASAEFLKSNNNTTTDELVSLLPSWIELFSRYNKNLHGVMVSAAFGYANEVPIQSAKVVSVLKEIFRALEPQGVTPVEISLADTVGVAVPEQVRRTVAAVQQEFPSVNISLHLHDTRGAGLANAYAGFLEGIRIFESSVGGLGGCPFAQGASGNIVTEDLAAMFEGQGVATGLNIDRYIEAARLAEKIAGKPLPGKLFRGHR